jgi:uridine kinase
MSLLAYNDKMPSCEPEILIRADPTAIIPYVSIYLIGGPSGSGKSLLATKIAKSYHGIILTLDSYFLDEHEAKRSTSAKFGQAPQWDHPKSVDLKYATTNITELFRTGSTFIPVYSFAKNRRIGYTHLTLDSRQVVIVEGIHALLLRKLLERADRQIFSIFVDAAVDVRRSRIRVRDANDRNRAVSTFSRRFYFMRIAERYWIIPQSKDADLVIDTTNGRFDVRK